MKKLVCVALVLLVCLSPQLAVFAGQQTNVLPSGLAYSQLQARIDAYVAEHEQTTAAVSVAVFARDQVLMEGTYGYTDREKRTANNSEAVFEWGSCTKLLTWVSVMQLVEQGAIRLDEDIRSYLPDGFLRKLTYDAPITVLNLMNHNAGWQETVTDLFIADKHDVKDLGAALRLIEPEQVNKPGSVVAYSNWGAALAGYIVERVSGQPFSAYVQQNIFAPLEMQHTALSADLSDNQWVSGQRDKLKCYTTDNQLLGTSRYYLSLYPAGGTTGTLSDFVKFAQAFVPAKGEPSPLFRKAETLDQMLSPSSYVADEQTARNYHGFWPDEFSVPVLWRNGGTLGSSSWFAFDPKSGTGMVILTNQRHETVYNFGLLPLVFGKFEPQKGVATSTPIAGVYALSRSPFKGYAKLGSLFNTMQLSPDGKGGYTVPGTKYTVSSLGANSYLMDMGDVQGVFYASTDQLGRNILQMRSLAADYISVNGYGLIAKFALLLVFGIAALYSLAALIIGLGGSFRRQELRPAGRYRLVIDLSVTAVGMMFAFIAVMLFTSKTALFASIQWSLIAIAVLALIPPG